ncbi:hypothetical protein EB796_008370 [Bugula neritina]|uniref:Sulfotransferase domain-containing protein n=1 Tax=Bugula neritina TaxID=10212 RepID=A0A7J7K5U1_BUGNE|nr:hypothetical protein EB796_008370 [Bugula neritina]
MAVRIINVLFMKHCIYLVIYSLFRCCQLISWWLTGVQSHLTSCRNGENYESSAQLLRVWKNSIGRIININLRHHFLSTHMRFVHPTYALQKHITLMTVTDKEAIFSIHDPDEDVLDVRKYPFLSLAQPTKTNYLLIMPISSMIKLGEELGDPKAKVIWIYHTGRCGSTAMSQVFNSLPDVVSISEPLCLFSLEMVFKEKSLGKKEVAYFNSKDYQTIYKNAVRLILKPYRKEAKIFAVKSQAYMSKIDLQLIPKLFPEFCEIFMYRGIKEQIISMYKPTRGGHLQGEISLAVANNPLLSRLLPNVYPSSILFVSCSNQQHLKWVFKKENLLKSDDFTISVIQFVETCFHYKEMVAKGSPVVAVKYEHLRDDNAKFFEVLFNHVGLELTPERKRLIDQALSEDSQKGTFLDRKRMEVKKIEITPAMIDSANDYLNYYGLPSWGEHLTLPNTIS